MGSSTVRDLAIGCVAISFAAIFFRLAGGVDPLLASALRLGMAALLLAPAIARARQAGRLGRRPLRFAALGGLLYAVHFGAWVASLSRTTVAASVTLVTATPIFLAIVATVRGADRPSFRLVQAIGLTAVGVAIIGGADARFDTLALEGDLLALIGALAMGGYLLVARSLGDDLDAAAFSGTCAAIGAVALFLGWAIDGSVSEIASIARSDWMWLALAALIPQAIGHTLLTRALRRATPTVVGLATCSEPVLSTLLAIAILHETPPAVVALGCVVTLAGVLLGARA